MRLGVFTALLSQLPLDDVIRKLRSLGVKTIDRGAAGIQEEA
jgi:sugar phosphate isomerase/epimerase